MNPTDSAAVDAAAAALHASPDLSMLGLFLQADWVVKGVMIALVLASVVCWAIVIEKAVLFARISGQLRQLVAAAAPGAGVMVATPQGDGLAATALRAGTREWREGRDPSESRGEYRHRIEHAMRTAIGANLRRVEPGLPFLATTGAVGPFIGLFGTVWGIMNSFAGIARSNDTSLAVVAPGIAEALFATAIGLVAAIPAVIAYNRLMVRLARLRQEANGAASELASNLSRRPPGVAQGAAVQGSAAVQNRAHAAAE
jgi:TolQ protein